MTAHLMERLSGLERHDEEEAEVLVGACVDNGDYAGMIQARHGLHLALETELGGRGAGDGGPQHLNGDDAARDLILRAPNLTHAAYTEAVDQGVAFGYQDWV